MSRPLAALQRLVDQDIDRLRHQLHAIDSRLCAIDDMANAARRIAANVIDRPPAAADDLAVAAALVANASVRRSRAMDERTWLVAQRNDAHTALVACLTDKKRIEIVQERAHIRALAEQARQDRKTLDAIALQRHTARR